MCFNLFALRAKTMGQSAILRAFIAAILIATAVSTTTDNPKRKRPPAVLSNISFRNLTGRPLLPGELNEGDGDTLMSSRDIQRTLSSHNEYRRQAKASNMQYMTWDATLATMSQRWAERCVFDHGFGENISPHESIGQNLWLRTGERDKPLSGVAATDDWHDEIQFYNYESDYCSDVCGHYTQVVWAETDKVGCGLAFCGYISGYRNAWNIVCNYGSAGNFQGVRPYKTGPVCTDCALSVPFCYNGLCRLCNIEEAGCSCPLACQNCGVLNKDKCYCDCPNGFHGAQCADDCVDTHFNCGANPGWPDVFACSLAPNIPKDCPLMCGECQPRDPDFTCDPNQPAPGPVPGPDSNPTPDRLCNTVFNSIAMINGELHVVKGKAFWRFDQQGRLLSPSSGELLKSYHPLVKKGVKGLYQIGVEGSHRDTISMIRGKKIWRFDSAGQKLGGWPKSLRQDLGMSLRVVAAVHDERYGITYMITSQNSDVYEYDENREELVQEIPLGINTVFSGLPNKISAAFRSNGYFYFQRGKKVYSVNERTMSVEGIPEIFAERFLGC